MDSTSRWKSPAEIVSHVSCIDAHNCESVAGAGFCARRDLSMMSHKCSHGIHVGRSRWPNHALELSRIFIEPIANSCDTVTWRIVIHKQSIVGREHHVHEWLQVVSKELNISICSQRSVQLDQRTQFIPRKNTPHHYAATTSLHSALLTTGVHGFVGSAPHSNTTICSVQLKT